MYLNLKAGISFVKKMISETVVLDCEDPAFGDIFIRLFLLNRNDFA